MKKCNDVTVCNTKIIHRRDGMIGITDYIAAGSDECVAWFETPEEIIAFINQELSEGTTRYIYVENINDIIMALVMKCVDIEDPFEGYGFDYIIKQNGEGIGFSVTKGKEKVLEIRNLMAVLPDISKSSNMCEDLTKLINFFEGKIKSSLSATAWDRLMADIREADETGRRRSANTIFPDLRIKLNESDERNVEQFCRYAYRGGFIMDPKEPGMKYENVTAYDINSSYGFQMKESMLPIMRPPQTYGRNQSLICDELPECVLTEEGIMQFAYNELHAIEDQLNKTFGYLFADTTIDPEEEDKLYARLYLDNPNKNKQQKDLRRAKREGRKIWKDIHGDNIFNEAYYTIMELDIYTCELKEGGIDWAENDQKDPLRIGCGIMTVTQDDFYNLIDNYDITFSIRGCVYFLTGKGIYSHYINFYEDKKEAAKDKVERSFAKAMINLISGRLAAADSYTNMVFDKDELGSVVCGFKHTEKKFLPGHIGAGSAITSKARRFLFKSIKAQGGYVAYCDTDSMHVIGEIRGIQLDEKKMGSWKKEHVFNEVKYFAKKWYVGIKEGEITVKMSGVDITKRDKIASFVKDNGLDALNIHIINNIVYGSEKAPEGAF